MPREKSRSVADAVAALAAAEIAESEESTAQPNEAANDDVAPLEDQDELQASQEEESPEPSDDEAANDNVEVTEEADDVETDEPFDIFAAEIEIKDDGIPRKISVREAADSYLRMSDYSRNMDRLRDQRRQAEQAEAQALQARDRHLQVVAQVEQHLKAELSDELLQSNPAAYLARKEKLEGLKERQRELQEEQAREFEQRKQAYIADQHRRMFEMIPEWQDQDTYRKETAAIRDYALAAGFSDEELANAHDARALTMMRKAYLYDQGQRQRQNIAAKKIAKSPKLVKGKGRSGPGHTTVQRKVRDARAGISKAKPGRGVDAAVDFLMAEGEARTARR